VTTLLVSRAFLAEYGDLLDRALADAGRTVDRVLLPLGDEPPIPADVLARIDVALLSRDVRFSPPHLDALVKLVPKLPALRWIHFGSSGASQYKWLQALRERGVQASSSVGANAEPVAQTAFMGLLMLARRAYLWTEQQRRRQWLQQVEPHVPPDLAGQTIAIVGLGSIGQHVARYAAAFRLNVIGVRRTPRRPDDTIAVIEPPSRLPDILPACDWLLLACPLTRETRGLVNAALLAKMKRGANLVNVSRGEVVDEDALIAALESGQLGGAYLDVFREEPLPVASPLWSLPNVVISPHNAAAAEGNNRRSAEIFTGNLVRFCRGEALINVAPQ
jgi:phosphoglycerate dehydrogenase-like enzyme